MKVLVLGATGATGRLVVQILLQQHHEVIALVRTKAVRDNEGRYTDPLTPLATKFATQLLRLKAPP